MGRETDRVEKLSVPALYAELAHHAAAWVAEHNADRDADEVEAAYARRLMLILSDHEVVREAISAMRDTYRG